MTDLPEPFRPQFHFSPRANWCNDPNGLVWFDGEYHLFYQYNPFGDVWGHMSWGHAVSTDLVQWTELPVAIAEDADGMIFSGSAVFDTQNTSGLGTPEMPPLVAIYTRHVPGDPQQQTQCLAFSTDRGRHWQKFAANPVLDAGLAHFRDPKVFWHAPSSCWVMIVAVSDKNYVSLYASPDLKAWHHLSDFGPAGGGGQLWECPDLFLVPVRGQAGVRKWVLKVDMFEGGVCGGSSAQYFVGHFDGRHFTPDRMASGDACWGWGDFGKDFYAAVTWSNLPQQEAGPIWIGWMSAHVYAAQTPTAPWRGAMTLPRSVALQCDGEAMRLVQHPVQAMQAARREHRRHASFVAADGETQVLACTSEECCLELQATLCLGTAVQAGFVFRWTSGDELRFGHDAATGTIFIDRSRSGLLTDNPDFAGRRTAPCAAASGGTLDFHAFLDTSSLEVFAAGGTIVLTETLFPHGTIAELAIFAQTGAVTAMDIDLWVLRP